jgi:hypothetical protein
MCLIAVRQNGNETLPLDKLENAYDHNRDGWGMMYADGRDVHAVKSMKGFDAFKERFEKIERLKLPTALHFRFATHGARDESMCHPFQVLSRKRHGMSLYMMHNGTMDYESDDKKDQRSDTALFVDLVIRPTLEKCPGLIRTDAFQHMIRETIGTGNKLVFMEGTGRIHIINRDAGSFIDKVWYSNEYSLSPSKWGKWDSWGDDWNTMYGGSYAYVRRPLKDAATAQADACALASSNPATSGTAEDSAVVHAVSNGNGLQAGSAEFQELVTMATEIRVAKVAAEEAIKSHDALIANPHIASDDEIADAKAEVESTQKTLRDVRATFWDRQKVLFQQSKGNPDAVVAAHKASSSAIDAEDDEIERYDREIDELRDSLCAMSEQEVFNLVTESPEIVTDLLIQEFC